MKTFFRVLIGSVLLAAIALGAWLLFVENPIKQDVVENPSEMSAEDDDTNDRRSKGAIQADFGTKIVYESENADFAAIQRDCIERNGRFDECGNKCEPSADSCDDSCAYTCEDVREKTVIEPVDEANDPDIRVNLKNEELAEFGVQLSSDEGWTITATNSDETVAVPIATIHPEDVSENEFDPPYDHFINANHVSVYPKGFPIEGLMVSAEPIEEDFGFALSAESKMFVTESGQPFALYLKPQQLPQGWTQSGYIFARAQINDFDQYCLTSESERREANDCEFMGEDVANRLIYTGEVDQNGWLSALTISKSISLPNARPIAGIEITNIEAMDTISNPQIITGTATSDWFSKGVFNVVLTNWDGLSIGEASATATGDSMTGDAVPFTAELSFTNGGEANPFSNSGTLIFQKANPSGLPQNDYAHEIAIEIDYDSADASQQASEATITEE